jgi:hypothetical protein
LLNITLPDGTTMSAPLSPSPRAATQNLCCSRGEPVEDTDRPQVRIDSRREHEAAGHRQSSGAHHRCLVDRMHVRAKGQQPFFDD